MRLTTVLLGLSTTVAVVAACSSDDNSEDGLFGNSDAGASVEDDTGAGGAVADILESLGESPHSPLLA